jgi:hypothetical protein
MGECAVKCPRCGKDNPAPVHTCTAPPAIYLAEQIEAVYEAPHLPRKAAAELRRLYEENVRLTEANGDKLSPTDDTALLRHVLYLIEAWERGAESADYWREIAALRERLRP